MEYNSQLWMKILHLLNPFISFCEVVIIHFVFIFSPIVKSSIRLSAGERNCASKLSILESESFNKRKSVSSDFA